MSDASDSTDGGRPVSDLGHDDLVLPFAVEPGHTVQLRYRLTRDGYREHVQTLTP